MSSSPLSVIDQVGAALSASSLQHQVIASNIANRESEGYQRLRVSFDRAMEGAATVSPDHEPASIEQDLTALAANAALYESLARALSRYFAMIGSITNYRG